MQNGVQLVMSFARQSSFYRLMFSMRLYAKKGN